MKFLTTLLLIVAGVTASAQTYIDFRKPMRLLYGGDTLIISLQGDSVIFSGKAAELVLRDSTLLEIIQAHGGTGGGGSGPVDLGNDYTISSFGGDETGVFIRHADTTVFFVYKTSGGQIAAYTETLVLNNSDTTRHEVYGTAAIIVVDSNYDLWMLQGSSGDWKKISLINYLSGSLTDGMPTEAKINAVTSLTPATATAGYQATIKDTDGTGLLYKVESDGTDWYYTAMTNVEADSTVINNYLVAKDSLYLKYLGLEGLPAGSVWFTNTPTGAIDSAHTEPAYIGWEMKDLPTLEEYEKDVKMINDHMERRVWYIDYETKELKSQYGWDGLGMMNTQSAYMIYHEITVRWMFEQNKKLAELQKVQIPADVTNILLALNGLKYAIFVLFGLFIFLIAFSIIINRK